MPGVQPGSKPWEVGLRTITLLTDFGLKDGNVGVMKGVILGIAPEVNLIDLSHFIQPQNIAEAAVILARSAPYFPPGTIHLYVVDPGVGTSRRPLAARLGEHYFVGPDNGLLTPLMERAAARHEQAIFVHLDRRETWRVEVSHVFHGRDIFAPCAARLALGLPLEALGTPLSDPVRLAFPQPETTAAGWRGEVIHIDHFGNISTNLQRWHLGAPPGIIVRLAGQAVPGLFNTFGDRPPGELIALYGSTGSLIIAQVNGSAAAFLGAHPGDPVEIDLLDTHPAGVQGTQ
jgi:hypothetical protein